MQEGAAYESMTDWMDEFILEHPMMAGEQPRLKGMRERFDTYYEQLSDFLEGKYVPSAVEEHLVNIYLRTQHKRKPIPTIYDDE